MWEVQNEGLVVVIQLFDCNCFVAAFILSQRHKILFPFLWWDKNEQQL